MVAWFEEEGLPLNHFLLGGQYRILMIPSYLMIGMQVDSLFFEWNSLNKIVNWNQFLPNEEE